MVNEPTLLEFMDNTLRYLVDEYPDVVAAMFSDGLPEWACARSNRITWDCFMAKRSPQECCWLLSRQLEMIRAEKWCAWPDEGTLEPLVNDQGRA